MTKNTGQNAIYTSVGGGGSGSYLNATGSLISGGGYVTGAASGAGTYTVGYAGSIGSGGWGNPSITSDIRINRPDGTVLEVGKILESIMEVLCIIQPDTELMGKYPSLKDAYESHQELLQQILNDSKLKESYDSYHTIKRLVVSDSNEANET
jgi:hypothetical protein